MVLYRAQVILPYFTNLPTDVIVNQFHYEMTTTVLATAAAAIGGQLDTFYKALYPNAAASRVNYIDWPMATVKVFKLSDPTPRIPAIVTLGYTTAGTLSSTIPTEVACVVSWNAAAQSGVRFQRLYNRIYLGAVTSAMMASSAVDNYPRFTSSWLTTATNAAKVLRDANTVDRMWVQVSNAGGNPVSRQIAGGWVDDGPDTQRRRSVLASLRTSWVAAP